MVKITILADNKVRSGLKAEWGFSALIEVGKEAILFDAGQSVAFENLLKLGKPMPSIIVLSHGHYDHTTGLVPFLKGATLYTHPDALLPRFHQNRYIGIPFRRELIESSVEKIIETREPVEVVKNVWVTGEIPRTYETALVKDSFLIRDGQKEEDMILDDQAIAIKTKAGVALVLGCCHSGLRNTMEWAEEVTGDEVKFVIGGTHMIAYTEGKIREIAKGLDIELIAPSHCTGFVAECLLKDMFGDRFLPIGSGSEIEI